jgi:hypothetical protein
LRLDVCVLRSGRCVPRSGRCVRRSGCRVPRYLASRSQFRLRTMAPPGRGRSSKRGCQRSPVTLPGNHRCSCEPRVHALRPGRRADARLAWGRTRRWRGARRANSSRRTGVRDARRERCAGAPGGAECHAALADCRRTPPRSQTRATRSLLEPRRFRSAPGRCDDDFAGYGVESVGRSTSAERRRAEFLC